MELCHAGMHSLGCLVLTQDNMTSGYVYAPGNNTVGFTWDNIMLSGHTVLVLHRII